MAAIVRALTAFSLPGNEVGRARDEVKEEIKEQLLMVLNSTSGTGVVHESVNAFSEHDWTRSWFGWANGLLGELVLKLAEEDEKARSPGEGWLLQSWQ
jgi:meiotically up-regulated gene 157 (Mug157) protein